MTTVSPQTNLGPASGIAGPGVSAPTKSEGVESQADAHHGDSHHLLRQLVFAVVATLAVLAERGIVHPLTVGIGDLAIAVLHVSRESAWQALISFLLNLWLRVASAHLMVAVVRFITRTNSLTLFLLWLVP